MSKASVRRAVETVPIEGPDGATPMTQMTLTGVVRTSKGFAVAVATITRDGAVTLKLRSSQSMREFVALEHKRLAHAATLRA